MGRIIKIELSDDLRKELEKGYRNGKSHAFRQRCQMVLLKSEGRKSQEIADFLGFCQQAVNFWLHRYKREGINGLLVRTGRGRPAILSPEEDVGGASGYEYFLEAIKNPRHSEHKQYLEWVGGAFDAEYFSLDETNERLWKAVRQS